MKNIAYLGLGSNLGDRQKQLDKARFEINQKIGHEISCSSTYETKAWGVKAAPDYLNLVLKIETKFFPIKLLAEVLALEKKLGRIPAEKWSDRLIDIDILYFNDWHFETNELSIPHPFMTERKFVLEPLNTIAPNFIHPILKRNTQYLLENLK